MATPLFPARARCARCRCSFNDLVLDRLYCSYRCAGVPAPTTDPAAAPRGCVRPDGKGWTWKTRYLHPEAVPQRLRDDPATNVYACTHCLTFHVGHARPRPEDTAPREALARRVSDAAEVGSVVERLRTSQGYDRTVLASIMKVRPIRLTELERGDAGVSLDVAMKAFTALGVDVELRERPSKGRR